MSPEPIKDFRHKKVGPRPDFFVVPGRSIRPARLAIRKSEFLVRQRHHGIAATADAFRQRNGLGQQPIEVETSGF